jgi:hypothetical protein
VRFETLQLRQQHELQPPLCKKTAQFTMWITIEVFHWIATMNEVETASLKLEFQNEIREL